MIKVRSVVANNDEDLAEILNKVSTKYDILQVIFLGHNPAVERIYQIIYRTRED